MNSQLKTGALLSYVVLALQNLVGLLYIPFMLRMMGQSEYGLYSIAASIIAYLTILDLGFGNTIVRYTAKFRAECKIEEQYRMFGMFFLLYCGIGFLALTIGGILCWNAENFFGTSMTTYEIGRAKIILLLMVFNLAITFPFSLFGSIITAYEKFIFLKTVMIARIVLNTVTMIVLLNYGYKAVAMVVVATIFNILTLGCNYWYCKHKLNIKLIFGKFQWGFLKEISIYSFWIFLNTIMNCIYWNSGQFILGIYSGTTSVAIFALAIQLQQIYMGFSIAICDVFLPKVTSMTLNDPDGKAVSDLFIKVGRIQYCVLILVLTVFFLFGRQFIHLWAGVNYDEAYIIALLFFIPLTIPYVQNMGIVILQARNQMKFRCLLYLAISLVCLGAQIPLAKYYGGIGCACAIAGALIIGQTIIINIYYQLKQQINITSFILEIARMSVVPASLTFIGYKVLTYYTIDSVPKLVIGIILYLTVYLPLFFKFSMNKYEQNLVLRPVKKILKKGAK